MAGEVQTEPEIGDAVIDPSSEPNVSRSGNGLATREERSYEIAKLRYDLEHAKHNGGFLGKLFGVGAAAATNIAGVVIVVCLVLIGGLFVFSTSADSTDYIKTLLSVLLTALGYLFGASSKK